MVCLATVCRQERWLVSHALPGLFAIVLFCMVATAFGEWCAERSKRAPEMGGRLALVLAAFGMLALALALAFL